MLRFASFRNFRRKFLCHSRKKKFPGTVVWIFSVEFLNFEISNLYRNEFVSEFKVEVDSNFLVSVFVFVITYFFKKFNLHKCSFGLRHNVYLQGHIPLYLRGIAYNADYQGF